jgi:nucleoside-diphosphate kinase
MASTDRFVFNLDWYDDQATLVRKYLLYYFPVTNMIEMYDVKNQRIFLKRMEIPGLKLDDFYIGAKVTILSRIHKVTDYGDVRTRNKFEASRGRTFAMIKPHAYQSIGKILDEVSNAGFEISNLKMSKFNQGTVSEFYAEHVGKPFFPNLANSMTSDVCIGMELVSDNAVQKWRNCLGPTNSHTAKAEAPGSLRAKYGVDGTLNACHGADSATSHQRETDFWFGGNEPARRPMQTTAVLNNCTLVLIKPHIVKEGLAGQVIDLFLENGFEISAMEMFNLSRPVIEEFYGVYKGVLPEYLPLIEHMTSGPMIAMEVR